MSERKVTIIEPKYDPITRMSYVAPRKRKVAGYARVSTDHDEQFTSYEAQIDYYTRYIQNNPEWEYVGVYTDEGISGLNTKNRDGFNRMIEDALNGKIDLILTKSVSRFARNTVDSLTTIRKLKDAGVECYFEKENIYTFDGKGELLLTIMSSIAQEESRSISENVTWASRKRFADGKVTLAYSTFLGYDKGPDKEHPLVIVEEEAKVIRRIYRDFISGKTPFIIAKELTADRIRTPCHKEVWGASTIMHILQNEKYKGSALLQKTFTEDFLLKKTKVNEGEVPQYFIEHSHEAIINPEEWETVQLEIERRKKLRQYSGKSVLGSKIICEDCGGFFGPKVWNSTDKYRRIVWQCNRKYVKGKQQCRTPHLNENDIKERFVKAFNTIYKDIDQIVEDTEYIMHQLTNMQEIDEKINALRIEIEKNIALQRKMIEENSTVAIDQNEYDRQFKSLEIEYNQIKEKIEILQRQKNEKTEKANAIRMFIYELRRRSEPIKEFDDLLWICTVDTVIVKRDGKIQFNFKNGMTVER